MGVKSGPNTNYERKSMHDQERFLFDAFRGNRTMTLPDFENLSALLGEGARDGNPSNSSRIRLVRDLLNGRYPNGYRLHLSAIAKEYDLDRNSAKRVLADLQSIGM